MYKAFQGANGWYVAWEGKNGMHSQPAYQSLSQDEAESLAAEEQRLDELLRDEAETV